MSWEGEREAVSHRYYTCTCTCSLLLCVICPPPPECSHCDWPPLRRLVCWTPCKHFVPDSIPCAGARSALHTAWGGDVCVCVCVWVWGGGGVWGGGMCVCVCVGTHVLHIYTVCVCVCVGGGGCVRVCV